MTSANEIRDWFRHGVIEDKKRMIVWCDTFDYEDYPEYSDLTGDDLREYVDKRNGNNMRRLMEVYDLTASMEPQMQAVRSYNY